MTTEELKSKYGIQTWRGANPGITCDWRAEIIRKNDGKTWVWTAGASTEAQAVQMVIAMADKRGALDCTGEWTRQ